MTPYTNRERRANIDKIDFPEAYPGQRERTLENLIAHDRKLAEAEREQAAVARAGGRAITAAVNIFFDKIDRGDLGSHLADIISSNDSPRHEVVGLGSAESVAHVWARCIDPAAGGWEWYAKRLAHVGDLSGYGPGDPTQTFVKQADAEDMLGWAIYREALTPQIVARFSGDEGGMDFQVTRGEVEIIDVDWDNYEHLVDYEREDLEAKRAEFTRIADPATRAQYLDRMDKVLAEFDQINEEFPA